MFRLWHTVPALRQKYGRAAAIFNQTLRYKKTQKCPGSMPQMRFIQFMQKQKSIRMGIVSEDGENFVNLSDVCLFPQKLTSFLKSDIAYCLFDLKDRLDKGVVEAEKMDDCINILTPILENVKILSTNIPKPFPNQQHCQDDKHKIEPLITCKLPNSIIGPTQDIIIPHDFDEVHCQTELAVVIGKKGKNITKEKAMDHVFGYTIALNIDAGVVNDKSVCGYTSLIASSTDTFCALGPSIVHKSLIENPHCLFLSLKVNDDSFQCENTSGLLFKIEQLIEFISKYITIDPGDVILTGRTSGIGAAQNKGCRISLKDGDDVESEIELIGKLKNKVKNEKEKRC